MTLASPHEISVIIICHHEFIIRILLFYVRPFKNLYRLSAWLLNIVLGDCQLSSTVLFGHTSHATANRFSLLIAPGYWGCGKMLSPVKSGLRFIAATAFIGSRKRKIRNQEMTRGFPLCSAAKDRSELEYGNWCGIAPKKEILGSFLPEKADGSHPSALGIRSIRHQRR